jgi:hypothetical protein
MRKIAIGIFLSFFVSIVNAAGMPIDLNLASTPVNESVSQDHCHGVATVDHHDDSVPKPASSANHYCCAVVAILNASPEFFVSQQVDVYLHSDASTPASNIAESIYKPPRNYL